MNDLGDLVFNHYAIKHKQSDLTYICVMLSSIDAFTQFYHPSNDMNSIGSEPHLRACKQRELQFIYIIGWMVELCECIY